MQTKKTKVTSPDYEFMLHTYDTKTKGDLPATITGKDGIMYIDIQGQPLISIETKNGISMMRKDGLPLVVLC